MSDKQIRKVELMVNQYIEIMFQPKKTRHPINEAKEMGAMALFGENMVILFVL